MTKIILAIVAYLAFMWFVTRFLAVCNDERED